MIIVQLVSSIIMLIKIISIIYSDISILYVTERSRKNKNDYS
jgi:hypothetical protein